MSAQKKLRPNWWVGMAAAVVIAVVYGLLWNQWPIAIGLGLAIGVGVAYLSGSVKRK